MPIVVQIDKIEDENKPLNETIDVVSKWVCPTNEIDEETQQLDIPEENTQNSNIECVIEDDDSPF